MSSSRLLAAVLLLAFALAPARSRAEETKAGATMGGAGSPGATSQMQSELPNPAELKRLSSFPAARTDWGRGVEALIEDAYRRCARTYLIGGRFLTLRMPFAENGERSDLADANLAVQGGGKANPLLLWDDIDGLLATEDFRSYVETLSDGREKIIIFDLEKRSWSTSRDWFYIDRMNSGAYPGLPHKPFVLSRGEGVTAANVYDYVYCVGRLGMDCSGFVWYVQKSLAAAGGLNLDRFLATSKALPRGTRSALNIGTWYFDPKNRDLEEVRDEVRRLLPGDIILFRAEDGTALHSGVIQSIDRKLGRIRYVQSTDEAPREERGVHESLILFDPAKPETSLKDPSLTWLQLRAPTFAGELSSPWRDDGERYRAVLGGGGTVVRLRVLKPILAKLAASGR